MSNIEHEPRYELHHDQIEETYTIRRVQDIGPFPTREEARQWMLARHDERGAVSAERERIVKALREQAECYPEDSRFAHVGHGYLSAAEFVESLDRVGGQ